MRRALLPAAALAAVLAAVYLFVVRDTKVAPRLRPSVPVAVIGSGPDAVAVAADGALLRWLPESDADLLPTLPQPSQPPRRGRLRGTMLQQALVLGASPPALRPYLAGSSYGSDGVDVDLDAGIELRFGDASKAALKWKAAATLLADPSITSLDYIDVRAPQRPSVGGSGHVLPTLP